MSPYLSNPGVSFVLADYAAVDHGYATTIHKGQGATVDRSYVLASANFSGGAGAALTSMIEPLMMVFLGGTVGYFMIAMYLPIFKLGQVV